MSDKYIHVMQELQFSRNEAGNYRQKYTLAEQQLQGLKQQNKQLKNSLDNLSESYNKLFNSHKLLQEEKKSLIIDYSVQINTIKNQISKKQRQLVQIKECLQPNIVIRELATKQLKLQLKQQHERLNEIKNKKYQELININQKIQYDKELQKQKNQIKISNLQKQLKQQKNRRQQIQEELLKHITQKKSQIPLQQRQFIKRTRRQCQELRSKFEKSNLDLRDALQQKNNLHKQLNKWVNDHKNYISKTQKQISMYKCQIERLQDQINKTNDKRQDIIFREKERDIQRLKNQNQIMRDQNIYKDKRISELQVESAKINSQLKIIKIEKQKNSKNQQSQVKYQRDILKKELNQLKINTQKLRFQNVQLNNRVLQANKAAVQHHSRIYITNQQSRQKIIQNKNSQNSPIKQMASRQKYNNNQLKQALKIQQNKLKQFLVKYTDLKSKYQKSQTKLAQANQKIMELLHTKIALSPKASYKTIEFPTAQRRQYFSPPPQIFHTNSNIAPSQIPKINHHGADNIQDTFSSGFRQILMNTHSRTNPVFQNRDNVIPERRQKQVQRSTSNDRSYYDKSLKIKNMHKIKELQCNNHNSHHNHQQ